MRIMLAGRRVGASKERNLTIWCHFRLGFNYTLLSWPVDETNRGVGWWDGWRQCNASELSAIHISPLHKKTRFRKRPTSLRTNDSTLKPKTLSTLIDIYTNYKHFNADLSYGRPFDRHRALEQYDTNIVYWKSFHSLSPSLHAVNADCFYFWMVK